MNVEDPFLTRRKEYPMSGANMKRVRGNCPDCNHPWGDEPKCPTCGLDIDDLEAAAAFYDRLVSEEVFWATEKAYAVVKRTRAVTPPTKQ
jgi:hypothetical protein